MILIQIDILHSYQSLFLFLRYSETFLLRWCFVLIKSKFIDNTFFQITHFDFFWQIHCNNMSSIFNWIIQLCIYFIIFIINSKIYPVLLILQVFEFCILNFIRNPIWNLIFLFCHVIYH